MSKNDYVVGVFDATTYLITIDDDRLDYQTAVELAIENCQEDIDYYIHEWEVLIRTLDGSFQMVGYVEEYDDEEKGCCWRFVEATC